MLESTTLKGLDDSLLDLQKAIEHLPDGSKRRQLMDRFQRLRKVRDNLDHPEMRQDECCPWWVAMLILSVVFFLLVYLLRKTKS